MTSSAAVDASCGPRRADAGSERTPKATIVIVAAITMSARPGSATAATRLAAPITASVITPPATSGSGRRRSTSAPARPTPAAISRVAPPPTAAGTVVAWTRAATP